MHPTPMSDALGPCAPQNRGARNPWGRRGGGKQHNNERTWLLVELLHQALEISPTIKDFLRHLHLGNPESHVLPPGELAIAVVHFLGLGVSQVQLANKQLSVMVSGGPIPNVLNKWVDIEGNHQRVLGSPRSGAKSKQRVSLQVCLKAPQLG